MFGGRIERRSQSSIWCIQIWFDVGRTIRIDS